MALPQRSNPIQSGHPSRGICAKCGQDHHGRCTSHRRSGLPCTKYPNKGTNVCRMHGGSAPQVKQAARLRLAALVDPSIEILARNLKPGRGKYVDPGLQTRTAWDILDRNGLKSRDEIILTQSLEPTQYSHLGEAELEVLIRMLRKISIPVDQHDQPADIEVLALPPAQDP